MDRVVQDRKKQVWSLVFCAAAVVPQTGAAEGPSGLLTAIDTPRAFDRAVDDLTIAFDFREDYRALTFGFQATERLQIALALPTYDDPGGSVGDNDLSFAFNVIGEGRNWPSLSVGLVGLGEDDRGAGEYVVAGKTFGPVSVSAGLGWGRFAGDFDGPRGSGEEGPFVADYLFAGESAGFANLVWQTPIEKLSATLEYSDVPNGAEDITYAAGLSYVPFDGLTLTGYVDNDGNAGARLGFLLNPTQPEAQPNIARGPFPYVETTSGRVTRNAQSPAAVLAVLEERLEKDGITVERFAMGETTIDVTPRSATDTNFARVTGRVARVLSGVAPSQITTFRITQTDGPFDAHVIVLDRAALDEAPSRPDAALRAWNAATFEAAPLTPPAGLKAPEPAAPRLTYGIAPSVKVDALTSDNLELTGVLNANASYVLSPQTRFAGRLGYRFLNQWEQIDPPTEPVARSDARAYEPDIIFLDALTAQHRFTLAPAVYGRVSAGYFERAYGGVSAEVLWRPPSQNVAFGVEATYVRKRAYEGWFGFEDQDATTLIGSVYANIGRGGTFMIVDAGQHLAGDTAVDLTLGRAYANGWRVAATTGWSEERDGALSFGAEIAIPLAWSSADGTGAGGTTIAVGGPTGDYGSRVRGTGRLYDVLRGTDRRRIEDGWGEFWN